MNILHNKKLKLLVVAMHIYTIHILLYHHTYNSIMPKNYIHDQFNMLKNKRLNNITCNDNGRSHHSACIVLNKQRKECLKGPFFGT